MEKWVLAAKRADFSGDWPEVWNRSGDRQDYSEQGYYRRCRN